MNCIIEDGDGRNEDRKDMGGVVALGYEAGMAGIGCLRSYLLAWYERLGFVERRICRLVRRRRRRRVRAKGRFV